MKQTSEIDDIKAALKRAAYRATHGTREERAGRFMPAKKPGNDSSRRAARRSKEAGRDR